MNKYLLLNNFRNHRRKEIDLNISSDIIILFGKNGSGKTNILEAVSLFAGGKGLRHCKSEEMTMSGQSVWQVTMSTDDGVFSCGYDGHKKVYKISEKNVKNLNSFAKNNYLLWLTYETDRLFVESPSARRRFIDMLASSKFLNHDENLKIYEKLTRERLKILKQTEGNISESTNKWLSIVEERTVKVGAQIAECRCEITNDINLGQDKYSDFQIFYSRMSDNLESFTDTTRYKDELFLRRTKDFITNSTTFGPNRSDWEVWHSGHNMEAKKCSAGEQKILLLGAFLSFVKQNMQNDKRCLFLLLDDVVAHLDSQHRLMLFKHINDLQDFFAQHGLEIMIWLSGTERELFEFFLNKAVFLEV
jgi:DNA replication and repair protein RecF